MIRLRTLGHIELSTDSGDADALIAQPKRFALLCYLAIPKPGTMFRRDTLLGVFWPEGDTDSSRTALRQALAHIRKALGDDVIVRRGSEEVGLNPDLFRCDVAAFEEALDDYRWTDAIEHCRGELLKGFFLSNGAEFERWLESERTRLVGRYAKALEELADAATAAGNVRSAVEWWQALTLHDPYDSRYAMGLMEALEQAGDPANALLYAKKHTELLKEELEIGPPDELSTLVTRIRADAEPVHVESPHPRKPMRGKKFSTAERQRQDSKQAVANASGAFSARARSRSIILWSIGVGIALATVTIWVFSLRGPHLEPNRLVVAPIENRTGDSTLNAVGQLAADWLTTALLDLTDIQVLPADFVSETYRALAGETPDSDRDVGPDDLAIATRASLVITGSYYRQGDELEFHCQLLDTRHPGTILFSANPTQASVDETQLALAALSEQMLGAVAVHLDVIETAWGTPYVEPRRPPTFDAYKAYADARIAMRRVRLQESKELHIRAIDLDSTFVAAYSSLVAGPLYNLYDRAAMDSVVGIAIRSVDNPTRIERIQLEFMRALADANLPRVLAVLREGYALRPSPSTCTQFTMHAVEVNRPRDAVGFMKACDEWDGWFPSYYFLTTAYHMLGEHETELKLARRARQALPDRMDMRFTEARALIALGDTAGALDVADEIVGGGGVLHMLLIIRRGNAGARIPRRGHPSREPGD